MNNRMTVAVTLVAAALLWFWSVARVDRTDLLSQDASMISADSSASGRGSAGSDFAPTKAELSGPVTVPEPELALSRDLAALNSQIGRAERLARRVGRSDDVELLTEEFLSLQQAVESRSRPWKESERRELHRKTRVLQHRVTKISEEMEEVASVRL